MVSDVLVTYLLLGVVCLALADQVERRYIMNPENRDVCLAGMGPGAILFVLALWPLRIGFQVWTFVRGWIR